MPGRNNFTVNQVLTSAALNGLAPNTARSRTGSSLIFLSSASPGNWLAVPSGSWAPISLTVGPLGLLLTGFHVRMSPPGAGSLYISMDLSPRPTGLTWDFEDYTAFTSASTIRWGESTVLFTNVPAGTVTVTPMHQQNGGDIRNGTLWAVAL